MSLERSPVASAHGVLVVGETTWADRVATSLDPHVDAVIVESSPDDGLDRIRDDRFGCVVTSATEVEPASYVASIRAVDPDLPAVLWDGDPDPNVASEAVAAGVSAYVIPEGDDQWSERVVIAALRAIEQGRSTRSLRRRARQFEALFADPETYTWILDPEGALVRANQRARDVLDETTVAHGDDPFWELGLWTAPDVRSAVRIGVERAAAGEAARFDATIEAGDEPITLDVSVKPVVDEAVTGIVVSGTDITERARLEHDLRTSEELHRVTLNEMTDTILITDDDGRFTYVCPNVHFIFGYSVEEIYEFGTIDALLGEDLFDPADLEESGTLANIERRATDKAGREHVLLVNVRQVTIQDGTTLYSCRDVTKRKQREQALAALHRTARKLLYAETAPEIAQIVVDDATDVLTHPGVAVYLFDRDENRLRPAAYTRDMEALHGPLTTFSAGDQSVVGHAFVEGETEAFDDVHDAATLANPATDVRGAIAIPLADHGVFVAGSPEVGAVDEVTRELADLLAATAEAALDRVERESDLRDRDRELQRQNRTLTRLNHVNEIIRRIDRAVVRAETREEIERAVPEQLTTTDRFTFAWIGQTTAGGDSITPRTWAGAEGGYLDSVATALDAGDEPAARSLADDSPVHVSNVADGLRDEPWRKHALTRDFQSVFSIPLAHDDLSSGVLSVYANRPDAFDETTRTVLGELAETIASAIGSVERKRALLSDTVVELSYEVTDPKCVFLRLARNADCTIELEGSVQQSADGVVAFASVSGAPIEDAIDAADRSVAVEQTHELFGSDDGGLLQFHLSGPFVATLLVEHGATLRRLRADPTAAHIVVDVPAVVDVRTVDEAFAAAYPNSELHAQRERSRSVGTEDEFHARYLSSLTDRQLEVIRAAYHGGYFESPRRSTGEDIAAALDISPAAFYQHIRKIQRKLFTDLFAGPLPSEGVE